MSYTITLTNGTIKTEIADGSIDQQTTDLTLIGKNSTGYGVFFNENFVKLLENFASSDQPNYPLIGQTWYSTKENRLKVYDGSTFVPTSGTLVGAGTTPPTTLATGEIWIGGETGQLWFNDGAGNRLAGPTYTTSQGKSGFETVSVIDSNLNPRTIVKMFVGQQLLGIFSNIAFTPLDPIAGFTGDVKPGFNAGTLPDVMFNALADKANYLLANDGVTPYSAESFVAINQTTPTLTGSLHVHNDTPLVLGRLNDTELRVNSAAFQIYSMKPNQDFVVKVGPSNSNGLYINATESKVGIFTTGAIRATLDVNGSAHVDGNLSVKSNVLLGEVASTTTPAGSFGIGNTYEIAVVGSNPANWLAVGAVTGTQGERFVATGVGVGNGSAVLIVTSSISGVTAPVEPNDAANKHYVDAVSTISVPKTQDVDIVAILNAAMPVSGLANLTTIRVIDGNGRVKLYKIQGGTWTNTGTILL